MNMLALIIATSISSSCINNFMTLPSWMPTSVSAADTFGSSQHAESSHRITSNTLAAVESIFDAYYERVYFQSAANNNDHNWNTNTYGPREFKNMDFTRGANLQFNYTSTDGTRTVPDTRRLIEFQNILQFQEYAHTEPTVFSQLVDALSPLLQRDTWKDDSATRRVSFSSSKIPRNRTPDEYDWTIGTPANYDFGAASPLWVYYTTYMHLSPISQNIKNFPTARMFILADEDYFNWKIAPKIENPPVIEQYITDLIDNTFQGSNASQGIIDISHRLKPDECSLIATTARMLAMMDRTYDLIPKQPNGFPMQNTIKSASEEKVFKYENDIKITNIEFESTEDDLYTFTCERFDDTMLTPYEKLTNKTATVSHSTNSDTTRDKGRFSGSSTSVSSSMRTQSVRLQIGTVFDFKNNVYQDPEIIGTNRANISLLNFGNIGYVELRTANQIERPVSIIRFNLIDHYPITVKLSVSKSVSRSCTSEITNDLTNEMIKNLIPISVPCKSAFDGSRVKRATVSLLGYACLNKYRYNGYVPGLNADLCYIESKPHEIERQDIWTAMRDVELNDVNSLRNHAYKDARTDLKAKMIETIDNICHGWRDPGSIVHVGEEFFDSENPGSYISFSGGSGRAVPSIGGHDRGDASFIVEIPKTLPSDPIVISRIGIVDASGITWFNDSEPVEIVLSFSIDNEGTGFQLSADVQELPSAACDALVIPMVTTDWNWKALKIDE